MQEISRRSIHIESCFLIVVHHHIPHRLRTQNSTLNLDYNISDYFATIRFILLQNLVCLFLIIFGSVSSRAATIPAPATFLENNRTIVARAFQVINSNDYWHDIMRTGKVQRFPGVFWTSFPTSGVSISQQGFLQAKEWAKRYFGVDRFVMFDTASDTYMALNTIDDHCNAPSEPQYNLQVRRMSKAFAGSVYGTAYVVMPDDTPSYPDSVWSVWEWPTITRNPVMEYVVRVSLPSGRQRMLWSRRDGPRGPPPPYGRRKFRV